jgi:hypothetical protein
MLSIELYSISCITRILGKKFAVTAYIDNMFADIGSSFCRCIRLPLLSLYNPFVATRHDCTRSNSQSEHYLVQKMTFKN